MRLVANRALHCARSLMGANVAHLRYTYGVDFTNALKTNINCINVYHQLDEYSHTVMSVLFDLRNCLRGIVESIDILNMSMVESDAFSRNDTQQIMDSIYVN